MLKVKLNYQVWKDAGREGCVCLPGQNTGAEIWQWGSQGPCWWDLGGRRNEATTLRHTDWNSLPHASPTLGTKSSGLRARASRVIPLYETPSKDEKEKLEDLRANIWAE